jgi:hypothetical protein
MQIIRRSGVGLSSRDAGTVLGYDDTPSGYIVRDP